MKFLVKEISPSKKEIRITLSPVEINGISSYIFGTIGENFDEGTLSSTYIPPSVSKFYSVGPNPAIIRLIVAYLKDVIGNPTGFNNTVLELKDNTTITIVNIAVDDITLTNLTQDTLPSIIVKLTNPLPDSVTKFDEVSVKKRVINTQEQEVYYISSEEGPAVVRGLAYDEGMIDNIGNTDLQKLDYQSKNELTSSFKHTDSTIIDQIISGSDENLKIDYSKFENHIHFGSAVAQIENFKYKVGQIQNNLLEISKSLTTSSLDSTDSFRKILFNNVQNVKNTFSPFEKQLYYNSDLMGHKYTLSLGANYIDNNALNTINSEKLENTEGFNLIYKTSGSVTSSIMPMFAGKYSVEDKPFYNHSGSFYLSFLMRGDETLSGKLKWVNNNENFIPKIPYDTLYSSSISQPTIKSGSWQRYIFHASQSYWKPHSSNPIIGSPGTITDFHKGSTEVTIVHGTNITGSYTITAGGRYSNLATTVTSSGIPFTGSISPAGELFKIYAETPGLNPSSSYLADIKITKQNPLNVIPFSTIYSTGSTEFKNWYNDQYESASLFDIQNYNSLMKTTPEYLNNDNGMNNVDFRKFVNMMGEHFDLIKNYIDGYSDILKTQYGDVGDIPPNLLPVVAKNSNWDFMLPVGKKENADMLNFYGASVSNINNVNNTKNNIWRNIVNNLKYIYKTKGTQNSVRALLNSYGFPPDIMKIKEHGASSDSFEDGVLSDNVTDLKDGIGGQSGNVSFTQKEDKMVSYIIDNSDTSRKIGMEWRRGGAASEVVEFIFKPTKGANTQTIIKSSGSKASGSLWDLILEPEGTNITSSRLTFRLNNDVEGSSSITNDSTLNISMSTDYHNFKNQNFWNVLLQRTAGPSGSDTYVSHSYQLYIGESKLDKLRVLQAVSMSIGGNVYSQSAANWIGTGSRGANSSSNLIIGETMTGSIAEFRAWKYPLSASKFKQHVFDRKSTVGNTLEDSQTNLIYHFRLNENWLSGSKNPKFKDYNPTNVADFSIPFSNTLTASLGSGSMYDLDVYDRIQFNVGIGGAYEVSDNNIIIDNERRFINNLNPTEPSVMNTYHPLINKRKASSILEITRSPQEDINVFILNQLGNFDFNDKFADPQDIDKSEYVELEKFTKKFFDHYNVSLDVNKFIEAQAAIFTKELITSIKRLAPARAQFSKVGVELKPTFFDRQKLNPNKIEKEILNFEGSIPFTEWENNKYSLTTIDNLQPAGLTKDASLRFPGSHPSGKDWWYDYTNQWELYETKDASLRFPGSHPSGKDWWYDYTNKWEFYKTKDAHIELASHTGSSQGYYDFTEQYELYKTKDAHIELASITGSSQGYYDFTEQYELYKSKDTQLPIASSTGSSPTLRSEWILNRNASIPISSHTGSYANLSSENYSYKNASISIASHTGSYVNISKLEPLYTSNDSHIVIASHTGSLPSIKSLEEIYQYKKANVEVSSATGSSPVFQSEWVVDKNTQISIASHTGSFAGLSSEVYNYNDTQISIASHTGSFPDFSKLEPLHTSKDTQIPIASNTGSTPLVSLSENLYQYKNSELDTSFEHDSSSYSNKSLEFMSNWYSYKNSDINVATATSSIPSIESNLFLPKEGELYFSGDETFNNKIDKSYEDFEKNWGHGASDVYFIQMSYSGSQGDYNTYHYEKRYIFHTLGDVEAVSGSNSPANSAFETDFTGTVTSGIHTSSKHFRNQKFLKTTEGLGLRPLGTTIEFKPTGSISFKGGKHLDETFIYPANHIYVVGTSRDSIDRLIYKGTQNTGGDILQSEAFEDLTEDAFYRVLVTGGSGYSVQSS